ncbi:hypothetical protein E2C01_045917 [Portunus trituberculatus]|uniref:Uncharacterized protein n=1 Tax=Portunus trituberculatus TaxID=210409 RepID=A0A5B7G3A6_PORTR|nr:hypothetical protein [Portunus trituberculatus]
MVASVPLCRWSRREKSAGNETRRAIRGLMKCARGSSSHGARVDGARGLSEGEAVPVERGGDMSESSSTDPGLSHAREHYQSHG